MYLPLEHVAQFLRGLHVGVEGVGGGVPGGALHQPAAGERGVAESVVHPHALQQERAAHAVLEVEHHGQRLALEAGVDGHHLLDDSVAAGRAVVHYGEDFVVGVVRRHGVVRHLDIHLINDVVCHTCRDLVNKKGNAAARPADAGKYSE